MKRINNLTCRVVEMDNLRLAFWKAGKGKRHAASVLEYQRHLEVNLRTLQQEIIAAAVSVGDYRYFIIYEPKERQICAAAFREQVLHHALMNVCHHYFDRKLIFDTYACRKDKGTYAALDRARYFTRRNDWFLKLDVKKFFASIQHDVLKKQLHRVFKDKRLLSVFYQVIDSYETTSDRGLPIGNLSSQYFANHHLCELDYFIKHELRVKAYVRYMDDMVLWGNDKEVLRTAHKAIVDFIEDKLLLALKPCQLNRTKLGLPFLGYRIFPYKVRLLQKSKIRFVKKIRKVLDNWHSGEWNDTDAQAHTLALVAFMAYADAKKFRKNVIYQLEGQTS